MFTSRAIIINYQVEASLQLLSILPFGSHYHAAKPVILLQKDELPSDSLFNTIPLRAYSKASHVSSEAIIPCAVFPQAGIIPIDLNLVLHGNATTVTKMAIELVENIYITPLDENNKAVLIDERVVSRQNCPISNWPSSSSSDPVTILKRLMFKVPQPAHFTCSDSTEALELSCSRSALKRGFCHPSGILANTKLKITHTFRTVVNVRGLSETGNSPVQDSGESETTVWITGNQEYKDEDGDDTNPPSYIRSFSTKLVDKEKIREIDQLAMEALQNDLPLNVSPPCYEDSPAESSTSSTSSSPTLSSWICHSRPSMDRFSLDESRSSHDTYVFDLAAYAERNSRPAVLAM
ncbi:hypothetical protein BGZ76_007581 [Entomortierella beljakovae]|nr:hypothetical protein BGZ76_007581 [Entomortierella beljakovae]